MANERPGHLEKSNVRGRRILNSARKSEIEYEDEESEEDGSEKAPLTLVYSSAEKNLTVEKVEKAINSIKNQADHFEKELSESGSEFEQTIENKRHVLISSGSNDKGLIDKLKDELESQYNQKIDDLNVSLERIKNELDQAESQLQELTLAGFDLNDQDKAEKMIDLQRTMASLKADIQKLENGIEDLKNNGNDLIEGFETMIDQSKARNGKIEKLEDIASALKTLEEERIIAVSNLDVKSHQPLFEPAKYKISNDTLDAIFKRYAWINNGKYETEKQEFLELVEKINEKIEEEVNNKNADIKLESALDVVLFATREMDKNLEVMRNADVSKLGGEPVLSAFILSIDDLKQKNDWIRDQIDEVEESQVIKKFNEKAVRIISKKIEEYKQYQVKNQPAHNEETGVEVVNTGDPGSDEEKDEEEELTAPKDESEEAQTNPNKNENKPLTLEEKIEDLKIRIAAKEDLKNETYAKWQKLKGKERTVVGRNHKGIVKTLNEMKEKLAKMESQLEAQANDAEGGDNHPMDTEGLQNELKQEVDERYSALCRFNLSGNPIEDCNEFIKLSQKELVYNELAPDATAEDLRSVLEKMKKDWEDHVLLKPEEAKNLAGTEKVLSVDIPLREYELIKSMLDAQGDKQSEPGQPSEPATPDQEKSQNTEQPGGFAAKINENFKSLNIDQNESVAKAYLEQIGFSQLTEGQQYLVLQNLHQLNLARIKEEGLQRTHENKENVRQRGDKSLVGVLMRNAWKTVTRKYQGAKHEKQIAGEMKAGGLDYHKENLAWLTQAMEYQPEVVMKGGKLEINYAHGFDNLSKEDAATVENFNRLANQLAQTKFEDQYILNGELKPKDNEGKIALEAKFNQQLGEILKIANKHKFNNQGLEAISYINKLEASVRLNQFISSDPEAAHEFEKINNSSEIKRSIYKTFQERGYYMGAGFLARAAATTALGIAGLPLAAATMGGFMARKRSKEDVREKASMSRRGAGYAARKTDFVSADIYIGNGRLDRQLEKTKQSIFSPVQDEEKLKLQLRLLDGLVADVQLRLENGMIDFGDPATSTMKQYELIRKLSEAQTWLEANQTLNFSSENRRRVVLESVLDNRKEKITSEVKSRIRRSTLMGIGMGATFAAAGSLMRDYAHAEGLFEGKAIKNMDEARMANDFRLPQEAMLEKTVPEQFTKEQLASTKSIVGSGEGVSHALKKQLMQKAQDFGYQPASGQSLDAWANKKVVELVKQMGYVNEATGAEVRVKEAESVAYLLEKEADGSLAVREYAKSGDGNFHLRETHTGNEAFEGGNKEEYEYIYNRPAAKPFIETPVKDPTLEDYMNEAGKLEQGWNLSEGGAAWQEERFSEKFINPYNMKKILIDQDGDKKADSVRIMIGGERLPKLEGHPDLPDFSQDIPIDKNNPNFKVELEAKLMKYAQNSTYKLHEINQLNAEYKKYLGEFNEIVGNQADKPVISEFSARQAGIEIKDGIIPSEKAKLIFWKEHLDQLNDPNKAREIFILGDKMKLDFANNVSAHRFLKIYQGMPDDFRNEEGKSIAYMKVFNGDNNKMVIEGIKQLLGKKEGDITYSSLLKREDGTLIVKGLRYDQGEKIDVYLTDKKIGLKKPTLFGRWSDWFSEEMGVSNEQPTKALNNKSLKEVRLCSGKFSKIKEIYEAGGKDVQQIIDEID